MTSQARHCFFLAPKFGALQFVLLLSKKMSNAYRDWQDYFPSLFYFRPVTRHSIVTVGSKLYFIGGLKTCIKGRSFCHRTEPLMESFQPWLGLATRIESKGKRKSEEEEEEEEVFGPANLRDWMTPWNRALPPPKIPRYNAAAVTFGKK